jgi:hypothetical protein
VINAAEVKLTGKKLTDKKYTWHTGYPGGLKQINVKRQLEKKPEEVRWRIHVSPLSISKYIFVSHISGVEESGPRHDGQEPAAESHRQKTANIPRYEGGALYLMKKVLFEK